MTRVVPALIVLAIVALLAATAGHPTAPVPAAAHTETGGTHALPTRTSPLVELVLERQQEALRPQLSSLSLARRPVETPRQKARRIITATWPKSQVDNAMRVVACESGFNQWATNTTDIHSDGSRGSYSWFQVGAIHRHDPEVRGNISRLYLPWTNARVAYRIWKRQGWWAWRNCAERAGLL